MSEEVGLVVICGPVGTAFLAAYLRDVLHVLLLWRGGMRTTGVVVDNAATHADSGTRWAPILAFTDRHGNRVTCKPIVRMDEKMVLGRELPVVYLEHKPKVMLIFTRWNMVRSLLENSILLLLGSAFLLAAVAGLAALMA
jgi:hypothetical protein